MRVKKLPQEQVVLVCNGADCRDNGAKKVASKLRDRIRALEADDAIRVQCTQCMGQCGKGPNVMVFPEGIVVHEVKGKHVETLLAELGCGPVLL